MFLLIGLRKAEISCEGTVTHGIETGRAHPFLAKVQPEHLPCRPWCKMLSEQGKATLNLTSYAEPVQFHLYHQCSSHQQLMVLHTSSHRGRVVDNGLTVYLYVYSTAMSGFA